MTLLRGLADGEDGRLMSQSNYLFLKKCRLFLKSLLNLLQYCFHFMLLGFFFFFVERHVGS